MNGESFTRQVHRRVRCATRRHVACGDWFDVDRFRRQLPPGESISSNRFFDFLFSLFIFCLYSSSVLYAKVRLIKFYTHFIAIVWKNWITIRSNHISFSSFFFLFFPASTCRSMHRLRDYLESLQITIMLRIMARLGRDITLRRTTRIEN